MKYYSFLMCKEICCDLCEWHYGQRHTDIVDVKAEIVKMLAKDGIKVPKRIGKLTESDFADGLTIRLRKHDYITLTTKN